MLHSAPSFFRLLPLFSFKLRIKLGRYGGIVCFFRETPETEATGAGLGPLTSKDSVLALHLASSFVSAATVTTDSRLARRAMSFQLENVVFAKLIKIEETASTKSCGFRGRCKE